MAVAEWKYFLQVLRYFLRLDQVTLDSYKALSLLHYDSTLESQPISNPHPFIIQHNYYSGSGSDDKLGENIKDVHMRNEYYDEEVKKLLESINHPDKKTEYKHIKKYFGHSTYSYFDVDSTKKNYNYFGEKVKKPTESGNSPETKLEYKFEKDYGKSTYSYYGIDSTQKSNDYVDREIKLFLESVNYPDMETKKPTESANYLETELEYKFKKGYGESTYSYYGIDSTEKSNDYVDREVKMSLKSVNYPDMETKKPAESVDCPETELEYKFKNYGESTYSYYGIDSAEKSNDCVDREIKKSESVNCPDMEEKTPVMSVNCPDAEEKKAVETLHCPDEDPKYQCGEYFGHSTYSYYDIDRTSAPMRLSQPDPEFKDKTPKFSMCNDADDLDSTRKKSSS